MTNAQDNVLGIRVCAEARTYPIASFYAGHGLLRRHRIEIDRLF